MVTTINQTQPSQKIVLLVHFIDIELTDMNNTFSKHEQIMQNSLVYAFDQGWPRTLSCLLYTGQSVEMTHIFHEADNCVPPAQKARTIDRTSLKSTERRQTTKIRSRSCSPTPCFCAPQTSNLANKEQAPGNTSGELDHSWVQLFKAHTGTD